MNNRLRWSILALAQPAEVQLSLFPDFVCVGDELAINFGEGLRHLNKKELTLAQLSAIRALDNVITAMSGEENSDFWLNNEELWSNGMWEEIRKVAKGAADALGLEGQPAASGDIYVPSKPKSIN